MNQLMLSRLTLLLIGACVLFGVLALAFWLGVGKGYAWLPADPGKAPHLPAVATLKSQDIVMPAFDTFAEITERPLFSGDRKPIAPDAAATADDKPAPPPVPLQVTLTGVIITPSVKLAMLHDKATNKSVSLREGMPLSGNQAGWTLVKIEPRKVTFSNGGEQDTELTLDVAAKSGGPASRRPRPPNPAAAGHQQQAAASNALRARIEKRRKELREQAEQARKNRKNDGKPSAAWIPHRTSHGKKR